MNKLAKKAKSIQNDRACSLYWQTNPAQEASIRELAEKPTQITNKKKVWSTQGSRKAYNIYKKNFDVYSNYGGEVLRPQNYENEPKPTLTGREAGV